MVFLVVGRVPQTGNYEPEQIAWVRQGIKQFQQDSHTKAFYGFAGESAACLICDVKTTGELDQYLSLNPLSMMAEWEVHPLVEPKESLRTLDMLEKAIKKAA